MAHLVQGLILLAAQASAAPGFSHRVHLKVQPDCLACHASAAGSARVEDNNLPKPAACAPCHKEARIPAPRAFPVAKFSHQQHLKMGNIGPVILAAVRSKEYLGEVTPQLVSRLEKAGHACAACHRGLDASDTTGLANFPRMADCLVCHNRIEPPFSCSTCHAGEAQLKPAGHTPDFIDRHSSPTIAKAGCAVCHGRRFTCMGCH